MAKERARYSAVPFIEVLELLEASGWKLQRIDPPYRVFVRGTNELPLVVEVHRGWVNKAAYDYLRSVLDRDRD